MNIYSICMTCKVDDCDVEYDIDYITHENLYMKKEFQDICEECLSKIDDNYKLKRKFINDYGFRDIEIKAYFDYVE